MRAAEAAAPLALGELDALFAPIAGARMVALAVSGGADSLALLVAADAWRRARGSPDLIVLTVDHRLRAESAADAAAVVAIAAGRGLAARSLVWTEPHADGDVEGAARTARYRLLVEAAQIAGASHLLTAHHRDDQAETFLMRLQRGSGLFGLAAMRREVSTSGLTLFRPFLVVPRSRLAATTAAAGMVPLDDPMNRDQRFLRARIRRIMPLLAADGFGPAEIAATARRLAAAADAIDAAVDDLIAGSVGIDERGVARIEPSGFLAAPDEVRRRLLSRIVMAMGGDPYPPATDSVEALVNAMSAHPLRGRFKRTLGGTVIEGRGGGFLAYRETGRTGLPVLALKAGTTLVWDHRYAVRAHAEAGDGLTVGALGEADRQALGLRDEALPAAAIAAVPAVRRGPETLAVPAFEWVSEDGAPAVSMTSILPGRLAQPIRFPDFGGGG